MNSGKATFVHKLTSVGLFLLLICVAWLLVQEWRNVKRHPSLPREPREAVVTPSETNRPPVAHAREVPVDRGKQTVSPKPEAKRPGIQQPREVEPVALKPGERGRTIRLADGREVTFGGLTYGFEHKYIHDKPSAKAAAASRSQNSSQLGTHTINLKTTFPSLVVWLHCRGAQGSLLDADFISAVDEAGKEGELSNPSAIFNSAEAETVGAWQISNFPRRDSKIGIRLYSRDSTQKFHRMAEFWAANPAPQIHIVWSPEKVPIVKQNGNVEYRVLNVLPDEPVTPHFPLPIRWGKGDRKREWTTSVFKVSTNGEPATRWKIESIVLSDATGNRSIPETTGFMNVGEYLIFSFDRTFWSSENAAKLTTEFTRTSGFSSNELVTFRNIRVPSANRQLPISRPKKLGEAVLHVEQLTHHRPALRTPQACCNMELTATLVTETPGLHVSIVKLTDQTGARFAAGISHKLADGRQSFLFHVPARSETLNITFAVQKSQFVEFVAPLRQDNALQAQRKTGSRIDQFKEVTLLGR